jgi:hypothetical protein
VKIFFHEKRATHIYNPGFAWAKKETKISLYRTLYFPHSDLVYMCTHRNNFIVCGHVYIHRYKCTGGCLDSLCGEVRESGAVRRIQTG